MTFNHGNFMRSLALVFKLPNFDGPVTGASGEVIAIVINLRVVNHVLVRGVERVGATVAHAGCSRKPMPFPAEHLQPLIDKFTGNNPAATYPAAVATAAAVAACRLLLRLLLGCSR